LVLTANSADAGKRLDVFLQERLSQHTRSRLQQWIKAGRVRLEGAPQRSSYRLRGGERLEVERAEPPPLKAVPEDLPLKILYEDADVVAVDKPAGMVVHAGAGCRSGTLVNALLHRFGALSGVGGELRPGIVHRLDRHTSGVLLVARNDAAHHRLAEQFASRQVEKVYLALVHGHVQAEQGRIEKPITRDRQRRVRMTARLARGRAALTEYRILRRLPGFTLLEVRPHTGRTHQIRAHFASLGHPLAGDRLYGAPGRIGRDRLFLHACRVSFTQPSTGERVTVESPLPGELERWLAGLL
jgi:23S rRNA pseudouridine1911/1915/1917 synthase